MINYVILFKSLVASHLSWGKRDVLVCLTFGIGGWHTGSDTSRVSPEGSVRITEASTAFTLAVISGCCRIAGAGIIMGGCPPMVSVPVLARGVGGLVGTALIPTGCKQGLVVGVPETDGAERKYSG